MEVDIKYIRREITKINHKKATTFKHIPTKVIKDTKDVCAPLLLKLVNYSINNSVFPNKLKVEDISPIFKKDAATNVKQYRAKSLLPLYQNFMRGSYKVR